jgi:hypothetical protein
VGGRLPPKAAHVRATAGAAGTGVMALDAGLQCRRRVARRVGGGSDRVVASRCRRSWVANVDITPQVGWKRAVRDILLEVLPRKTSSVKLGTGRHRQIPLTRRRSSDGRDMAGQLFYLGLDSLHAVHSGRKSRRRSSSSLLYRANMLVLMSRQSCTASKSLLAVGVGALVRPITRMGTSMTSERAAIAEGLRSAKLAKHVFVQEMKR